MNMAKVESMTEYRTLGDCSSTYPDSSFLEDLEIEATGRSVTFGGIEYWLARAMVKERSLRRRKFKRRQSRWFGANVFQPPS